MAANLNQWWEQDWPKMQTHPSFYVHVCPDYQQEWRTSNKKEDTRVITTSNIYMYILDDEGQLTT